MCGVQEFAKRPLDFRVQQLRTAFVEPATQLERRRQFRRQATDQASGELSDLQLAQSESWSQGLHVAESVMHVGVACNTHLENLDQLVLVLDATLKNECVGECDY